METFATLLKMMDSVKEGNGTLLDHSLVLATSESNYAKLHSIDSLPIMVAGNAGGKWNPASTSSARAIPARASA